MVKEELGSDAVILHTKRYKTKSGILGLKSKSVVEVTAAIEDNEVPARPPVVRPDMDAGNIRQVIARTRPVATENPVQTPQPTPRIDIQSTPQPISVLTRYKTDGTAAGVEESAQKADRIAGKKPAISRKLISGPGARRQRKKPVASTPLAQPVQYQPPVQSDPNPAAGVPSAQPVQYQPAEESAQDPRVFRQTVAATAYEAPVYEEPYYGESVEAAVSAAEERKPEDFRPMEPVRIIKAAAVSSLAEQEKISVREPVAASVYEEPVEAAVPAAEERKPEDFRPMEAARIIKATAGPNPAEQEKISALESEVAQLRELLKKAVEAEPVGNGFVTLKEALRDQDINEQVLEEMIRCMPAGALSLDKDSPEALAAVTQYCKQLLRDPGMITLKAGKPRIVALVGTTGVGKTTTLAKIAAKFVLERGTEVALITADTYRISAVEQLKTYSDIIGLPLEIVYSPAELKSAIRKFRLKGLILIDTAGRNQHNDFQIKELVDLLAVDSSIEKHLVLSATTKERDAVDVMDRFAPVKPDRLLFTKTDETESIGTVVNLISSRRAQVSYFTNGQSVPDDIEAAGADILARMLLK